MQYTIPNTRTHAARSRCRWQRHLTFCLQVSLSGESLTHLAVAMCASVRVSVIRTMPATNYIAAADDNVILRSLDEPGAFASRAAFVLHTLRRWSF